MPALKSAEGLSFAHEEARLTQVDSTEASKQHRQAMLDWGMAAEGTLGTTLGLADAMAKGTFAVDENGKAIDVMAEREKEAEQATEDLAKAQEALADATEYARDAIAGFYDTLGGGINDMRSLGEAQEQSAKDYAAALKELEADAGESLSGIKEKYEDSLPDPTTAQQRMGMAADAWDEWGLRLQDIMENGVASPWAEVLQQMGYEQPPDTGIKEWASGLKDAFYAGDVQGLVNEDAQAWRDHTATVQEAQAKETAAVQSGLAERRAALEAARQEELAAEKKARDEALLELTLNLAEQTGQLEKWATGQYGADFAAGFDQASEVLTGLKSGLVELGPALQNLLTDMASGVQATMDQTGATAAANEAALESLWETARAGPTQEDLSALDMQSLIDPAGVETAMSQVKSAITDNLPTEEDLQTLDITRLVDPEAVATVTDTIAGIGTAISGITEEDPFGFMGLFSGAAEGIIEDSARMADEAGASFTNMGLTATGVAADILNEWTGNSVFPDLITDSAGMASSVSTDFGTVGESGKDSANKIGDAFTNKMGKAREEVNKLIRSLKAIPQEITITILTSVASAPPAEPGLQHGGQWTVRGPGGIDNVPVHFMATAGEVVTVTPVGKTAPKTPGYQYGGQFTVPGTGTQISVGGDTHNWYIQDQGSVALAMRLVETKRRERLNEFMGG